MSELKLVPPTQDSVLDDLFARTCELFRAGPVFERDRGFDLGTRQVAATIEECAREIFLASFGGEHVNTEQLETEIKERDLRVKWSLVDTWGRTFPVFNSSAQSMIDSLVLSIAIVWVIGKLQSDSAIKAESDRRYALREEPQRLLNPPRRRRRTTSAS